MEAFLQPLQGLAEFEEIKKRCSVNRGILNISGCMESQKVHLMYGLSGLFPCHLILADDERSAKEIYEDYRFYDKNVYFYPAKDLLFFQADIHGNLLIRQRMRVIRALLEQEEVTVVTSIDGCMDFLMPLEKIRSSLLHFKSDSVIDLEKLKADLVELGYERVGQVELPGQFSVRGGIIDIYPLTEENPWRIELWDDEIDSIRSFDAESQRSLEMQMRSPFIRLWRKTTVRIWYLFWIIFRRKKLCCFWMSQTIWLRMARVWRRSIARAVCTGKKKVKLIFRSSGSAVFRKFRKN